MASQEHSVVIRIDGQMSGSIQAAIRQAQNGINNLSRGAVQAQSRISSQLSRLQSTQSNNASIQAYQRLQGAISQTVPALSQMRTNAEQLRRQMQEQEQAVNQYKEALQRLRNARATMNPRSSEYRVMGEQIRQATQELKQHEQSLRQTRNSYNSQVSQITRLNSTLENQKAKLRELHAALSAAGVSAQEMAQSEAELQRQIERTNAQIERQQNYESARENQNSASQTLFNAYGNFQNTIGTAQSIMSPFTDAIQTAADFQQTMSAVGAITGTVGTEMFDALSEKAQEMGASTAFSASQAAQAMVELGRAGWTPQQMLDGINSTLALAAAGGTDLATTATIMSGAMNAFGLSGSEAAQRVADVMTTAANNSATSVNLLGETMKYAGGVAGSLGYSIEDLSFATALMAKQNIAGSEAGTALRSIMTRLVKPPKEAAEALSQLGVAAANSDGTMKPLGQVLTELRSKFSSLTDEQKAQYANAIAGQEAMAGLLAVLNGSDADFDPSNAEGLMNLINNSGGVAERTAAQMQDNLKGAFTAMLSAAESVSITIGNQFLPTLQQAAERAQQAAADFKDFAKAHPEIVQGAGAAAAAVSALIVALAGVGVANAGIQYLSASFDVVKTAASNAVADVRAFWAAQTAGSSSSGAVNALRNLASGFASVSRAALGMVFSPVGIALMALGAAAYYVYTNWENLAPVFEHVAGLLSGALTSSVSTLSPALSSLGSSFAAIMPSVQALASTIGGLLVPAFLVVANVAIGVIGGAVQMISGLVTAISGILTGIMTGVKGVIEGDWTAIWEGAKQIVVSTFDGIVDIIKAPFSAIGNIIDGVTSTFGAWDAAAKANASGGGAAANAPAVDTSQTQAEIDALGASAANAQAGVDAVAQAQNQVAVQTQAGAEATLQLQTNSQNVSTEFLNLQTNGQLASTELTNLMTTAQTANPQIVQLGTDSQNSSAGVQSLGAAASATASSLSQIDGAASSVASALSAKAAQISSIQISSPTVASNAQGGIYAQGAFLTTFAEESAEAAIPLDGSERSINLWKQAGAMLGQMPGGNYEPIQTGTSGGGEELSVGTSLNQNVSRETFSPQITINVSGESVRGGLEAAGENLISRLEQWWSNRQHEIQRRSFA